jgi:ankyrin repeat protein
VLATGSGNVPAGRSKLRSSSLSLPRRLFVFLRGNKSKMMWRTVPAPSNEEGGIDMQVTTIGPGIASVVQKGERMPILRFFSLGFTSLITVYLYFSTPVLAEQKGLIDAAALGDVARVKALIAAGVNPNIKAKDGTTALFAAAEKGHLDVVRALLGVKADVNAKANETCIRREGACDNQKAGSTALFFAAENGYSDVVKALLGAGANVNTKTQDGTTALYVASGSGRLTVVQVLLAAKAEVNAKVESGLSAGETPLFAAVRSGNTNVVQALLDAKADVSARSSNGYTALMKTRSVEVAQLLLTAGADVNAKNNYGETALSLARIFSDHALEQFLSERSPNDPSNRSCSATISVHVEEHARTSLELRQGVPGDSKFIQGQKGVYGALFEHLCYGLYFIAIGDGDILEITPLINLYIGQNYIGVIQVTHTSGNIRQISRSGL